ncbi:MAG: branched-chain amino acid ABC transporter substrate-binding protein [Desulforudis sp.]|jgi:branched-chain amino acid transport system substrate-binding protein|nr:MAG: branched-chain amino acid ABC transporter substrate-binding protein [Desulforudis sp.]
MALLLVVALVTLLAVGCGGGATEPNDGGQALEVIKVASVSPLSGPQAGMGEPIKLGAQMALEEQKAEFEALGFKLELSPQDDQADPKVGVTVAQKLIADKNVLVVVGHLNSGVAIPASEVYVKDNLCQVSPANTATAITDRELPIVNRIVARDDAQGPAGADFATNDLGAKKVFVIHDKTTYGQGVADEFKKQVEANGVQVVGYEGITAGESDFSAVLNAVAAAKPDVVYFGGMYPEGSLLAKQMKEKDIAAKFIGPDGMYDPKVIEIAGEAAIGVYCTSVAGDVTLTEVGRAWADRYQAKFGQAPGSFAAYGYDATNVALEAIKQAIAANGGEKPSRLQVTEVARAIQDFKGVATDVTFNVRGDNKDAKVFIYEFTEMKFPAPIVKEIVAGDYLK